MIKKLGNYSLLIGLLCLVIFFSSSTFLVDEAWFLVGGIGLTALGLLIKRRRKMKRGRKNTIRRKRRSKYEVIDESS